MFAHLHRLFICIYAAVSSASPAMAFSLPHAINDTSALIAISKKTINATAQPEYPYQRFLEEFGLQLERAKEGKAMLEHRRALFEARSAEVEKHNSRAGVTWMAEVNHFADSTEDERRARLGFKPITASHLRRATTNLATHHHRSSLRGSVPPATKATASDADAARVVQELQSAVDWGSRLPRSAARVRDQGMCGSCWAVAAVGALEMHTELASGKSPVLSYMNLVDCVSNPNHCGGTGGCGGATAELAFDYVRSHGIVETSMYAQRNKVLGTCAYPSLQEKSYVTVDNFVQLPANQVAPVLEVLANVGPLAAGIDADGLFAYKTGVFNACPRDAVVNHAVLLLGYGQTRGIKYWRLRNSWGEYWGENGFFNLLRHDKDEWHGAGIRHFCLCLDLCTMGAVAMGTVTPCNAGLCENRCEDKAVCVTEGAGETVLPREGSAPQPEDPVWLQVKHEMEPEEVNIPDVFIGLPVEFITPNGEVQTIVFKQRPLGMRFEDEAPLQVVKIVPGGGADKLGVKVGWQFCKICGKTLEGLDWQALIDFFQSEADKLPLAV